jgi:hypothetical protein
MKFSSAVTGETNSTSLKADEKMHSLSQNQQSLSIIVGMLQLASHDFSAVDCSRARSSAVVRNGTPALELHLCFTDILNHFCSLDSQT